MHTVTHEILSPMLELYQLEDGFWLWDSTRGMNLAMRAKTEREAFVTALEYYQTRLAEVEKREAALTRFAERFIDGFGSLNDEN